MPSSPGVAAGQPAPRRRWHSLSHTLSLSETHEISNGWVVPGPSPSPSDSPAQSLLPHCPGAGFANGLPPHFLGEKWGDRRLL